MDAADRKDTLARAAKLPGDFVECGVNTGIFAQAACNYIDFNATSKTFWLFDTFRGIPIEQISAAERSRGRAEENAWYPDALTARRRISDATRMPGWSAAQCRTRCRR